MNEAKQCHWTLLHRPRWMPLLGFAVAFAVLLLISGASFSSPLQVGVIFLTTLGYILIFDSVRILIKRASSRRGIRVVMALAGIGLALLLGFLITQWGEAVTAPPFVVASVRFSITIAIAGACGAALARPKQPSDRNA
jgi:hypothetical protein